jgi:hypothetical protein
LWNYIFIPKYRRDIKTLSKSFPDKLNIGYVDTETSKGHPFLLTCYDKSKELRTDRFITNKKVILDQFISWCNLFTKENSINILSAHNLLYDMSAILYDHPHLFLKDKIKIDYELKKIKCRLELNTKKVCFGTLRFKDGRIVKLIDTYAFTFSSLKNACESYQLKFNKLPPPKSIGEKKFSSKKFYEYSDMDVISGYELLDKIMDIHKEYDIDICVSIPQLASKVFRKKFIRPNDMIAYPDIKEHDLIAQRAYHGGKNGCYISTVLDYSGDTTALDIVSAYPMAMTQLPSMLKGKGEYVNVTNIQDYSVNGVYAVWGEIKKFRYSLFFDQYFHPIFGKQMFYTTGYELKRAIENDLLKIHKIVGCKWIDETAEYKPMADFSNYFFTQKRDAKDKVQKNIAKIILNSLTGKFFSKIEEEALDNNGQRTKKLVASGLFNPFIASLITGYTRGEIFDAEIKYNAIHTATDGIIVPGKIKLKSDGELGQLETEAHFKRLYIFRTKVYCGFKNSPLKFKYDKKKKPLNFKEAHHGFNGTIETLFDLYKRKEIKYKAKRMTKMRESVKAKNVLKIPLYMQTWDREINIDFKKTFNEINYLE